MAELREVDGFLFSSEEEYQDALKEEKAVLYLKKQMSGKDGKSILKIYNQLLEQKLFHTEVGFSFLHDVNLALHRQTKIESSAIAPIPVERKAVREEKKATEETKEKPPKVIVKTINSNASRQVKQLRIVIVVMALVIAGMFAITLTSRTPTIIDYEIKLQNKYSEWDKQLTQREAQIREKEAQLNLD